jgi:aarF domain-containing kinase
MLLGKSIDLNALFDELQATLVMETNYIQEGKMLEKARNYFKYDNRYAIPIYYQELSTKKILAMEYLEGMSISDWLKTNPKQEQKNKIGVALYELFLEEFFKFGIVQTDPNPGNFLINEQNQIILLDFGAAKEYDEDFKQKYKEILRAAYLKNKQQVINLSIDFNLISAKESKETLDYFYEMMDCMVNPFRMDAEFDFNDQDYFDRSKTYAINITKKCRYSPPPEKILFLHRKLGGVFQLLKKMQLKLNVYPYWGKYINVN